MDTLLYTTKHSLTMPIALALKKSLLIQGSNQIRETQGLKDEPIKRSFCTKASPKGAKRVQVTDLSQQFGNCPMAWTTLAAAKKRLLYP